MALPSDILGDSAINGTSGNMPALTPQWMLPRSNSNSVLESRSSYSPDSKSAVTPVDDKWRPSKPMGGDHLGSLRWKEEERDARREPAGGLGRWGSASIPGGDPLMEAVRGTSSLKIPDNSGGSSRWESHHGRGRGSFDSKPAEAHNWGSSRSSKWVDRWESGDLPGMGTAAMRPPPVLGKFLEPRGPQEPRSAQGGGGGESWRSNASGSVLPSSASSFNSGVPGADVLSRTGGSLTAGRGRGFIMGRGRGIKPPTGQGSNPTPAFFSRWDSASEDLPAPSGPNSGRGSSLANLPKANRLVGTPPPGVRNYTIGQAVSIYDSMPAFKRPQLMDFGEAYADILIGPSDPPVPKPHHVLETHAAVVAETWSHPDATNQPLVTPVLNRTRTDSAGFLSREGSYALEASAAASSGAPGMKRVESWKDESQPVLSTASATSPKPKQPSMLDLSANAPNAASEPMPDAKPPQPAGNLTGAGITSPSTLAVILGGDQWVYRDPQLQIQGPFTKQDLVEWFDAGFFPQDLPIKSLQYPEEAPFIPLRAALSVWLQPLAAPRIPRAPPGFFTRDTLLTELNRLSQPGAVMMHQQLPPTHEVLMSGVLPAAAPLLQQQRQAVTPSLLPQLSMLDPSSPQVAELLRVAEIHQPGGLGQAQAQAQAPLQQQGAAHAVPLAAPQSSQHQGQAPLQALGGGGGEPETFLEKQQQQPVAPALAPASKPQPQPLMSSSPWGTPVINISSFELASSHIPAAAPTAEHNAPVDVPPASESHDDDELLFPSDQRSIRFDEPRQPDSPSSHVSQPAILPPRRKTPAVVAASKAPPKPKAVPEPQPEPRPLVSPWEEAAASALPRPAATPRPETKVAPWAVASTAIQSQQGKSLAEIQLEEREKAAAEARAAANVAAAAAPPAPETFPIATVWTKVASKSNATGPSHSAVPQMSLREIQMQEALAAQQAAQMQRQAMEAQAAATKPSGPNGEVPSVITLADMLPQEGSVPKGAVPAWGGSRPHIISNFEETAADMEGGAHEEGIEEVLAAFHRARGTSLPPQAQPSLPLPTRPQPQPQAPTAAISLRDIQAEEMKRHSKQQQVAAAPVQPPQDSSLREYRDEKQALAAPERSGPSADSPLAQRSPAFIQWCREQMIELRNDPDLSLVEFLLSVTSSGEVADYTEMYLGKSAKVANFTAEFIRRKFADVKASGSGTSRKAKKKAAAAVAVAMTVGLIPPSMQCLAGFASASAAPVQKPSTPSAAQVVASAVARAPKQALQAAARQPPTAQAPAMLPPTRPPAAATASAPTSLKPHGPVGLLQPAARPPVLGASPVAWPGLPAQPASTAPKVSAAPMVPAAPAVDLSGPPLQQGGNAPSDTHQTTAGGGGKKGKKGKGAKGQKINLSMLGFSTNTDYSAFEKPDP